MPFAWSAVQLFQANKTLSASGKVTIRDLIRIRPDHSDDKLPDLIKRRDRDAKARMSPPKFRVMANQIPLQKEGVRGIPGEFKLGIGLVNPEKAELPGRVDPN